MDWILQNQLISIDAQSVKNQTKCILGVDFICQS